MIYNIRISFRPLGVYGRAWFSKYYTFQSREEQMNFFYSISKIFKHWPFEIIGFTSTV